ncbi:unnamed protein product [Ixodes pacificus]
MMFLHISRQEKYSSMPSSTDAACGGRAKMCIVSPVYKKCNLSPGSWFGSSRMQKSMRNFSFHSPKWRYFFGTQRLYSSTFFYFRKPKMERFANPGKKFSDQILVLLFTLLI